jgi:hypothetical protein
MIFLFCFYSMKTRVKYGFVPIMSKGVKNFVRILYKKKMISYSNYLANAAFHSNDIIFYFSLIYLIIIYSFTQKP